MRHLVRIYRHGSDYSAMAPDVPGCVAAGDSVEEVRSLMGEAIRLHLDMMRRSGERLPRPARHVDLRVGELDKDELYTWVEVKTPGRVARIKRRVG
jgi:predicted RNase H-like HicB family nuclease